MNKAEFAEKISEKAGVTKKDAEAMLSAFVEVVSETLVKGEKVQLIGFGTFETRIRKGRQGVNPQNPKQKVTIPASKVPTFKAGKKLKEIVNH